MIGRGVRAIAGQHDRIGDVKDSDGRAIYNSHALGCEIVHVPAADVFPYSVFVEDIAILID